MTHLWAVFHPAFVAWFKKKKSLWCHSVFYIATSCVQSWRRALLCFLLLLIEQTHNHRTHPPAHRLRGPGHRGLVPPRWPWMTMSNAVTVKTQSPKIRRRVFTMTPGKELKKATLGKTGSVITAQCTLGSVISPGALKGRAKHLRGAGRNVSEDGRPAVPEHIGGELPLYCPQSCRMFHACRAWRENTHSALRSEVWIQRDSLHTGRSRL